MIENKEELLCIYKDIHYWVYSIYKNEFMFKKWILEIHQNDKIYLYIHISDN